MPKVVLFFVRIKKCELILNGQKWPKRVLEWLI